ncbi:MAG: PAS domain S-box protein [Pseudomonadota bacterium]
MRLPTGLYTTGEPVKGLVTESVKKDGSKIYAETSISLIRDSEGKPIGFRGIVRDISEQRELQQRLQHAQKLEAMATLAGGDNPGCG